MPVYNVETSYLMAAIESILNQTYANLELIIIDSSDKNDVKKLVSDWKDIRLQYYFRERNGISDALNYGLKIAKGSYIARMDADDISLSSRFEKQVLFLEKFSDVDVVGTYLDWMDCNGNIIDPSPMSEAEDYETIKSKMIFSNVIGHPTVMLRKKVIDAGWSYRKVYGEDHDLWTRMIPTIKFANIGEVLLHYRQYEGSISFQGSRFAVALDVAKATKKYVEVLFDIDISRYKDEDFAKNYYLYFFYDEIEKNLTAYIMRQLSLLYQIYRKNEEMCVIELKALVPVLNERWQMIMNLIDCILPELNAMYKSLKFDMKKERFFIYHIADICNCKVDDQNEFQRMVYDIFYRNELLLKEQFSGRKNFLIYGMGEQGRIILERCEQLAKKNKFLWNLKGIIDRRKIEATYLGNTYNSLSKEQIKEIDFDYILVSSTLYFEDIMKDLIELGVDEKSVIRGGGLYLIE